MTITLENPDSLASIKKHIIYKKVKKYTYRKLQKYLYTNPHTHTHTHTAKSTLIHIIQCPEQYTNQDSPKYRTGLLIVNVLGVQEGGDICFVQVNSNFPIL
jgi:hypothetical protein